MTNAWKTTTFGTLGSFRNGINFTSEQEGYGLPVLKVKDFANHSRVQLEGLDELDPGKISVSQDQLLSQGDTVIIRSNGNPELVGRSMFFLGSSSPVAFSGFCIRFRPAQDKIDPAFAAYFLKTPYCRKQFTTLGTGTSITNLNQTILSGLSIDLPPLPEQRTIAHILGTLDDKIELNRQMNQTLEGIARALFQSWFVDFEPVWAKVEGRPSGLAPEIEALFPNRFVDTEMGPVPEGWRVGTVGDVADNLRRTVQPNEVDADVPYIGLQHMPQRNIALAEWGRAEEVSSGKYRFVTGEILFGKLRPYFHKVGVAPLDGVCSTDILVIAPKQEDWFGFVLGHLSSDKFVDYTTAVSTGTRMPRTDWQSMARYPVVLPSMDTAKAYTDIVEPLVKRIHSIIFESQSLNELRDTLLPKLISGELRVQSF